MSRVDIGFLEKADNWLLKSHLFPSKVGGKPSWLDLDELPSGEDLKCEICNLPLVFLSQVYAPFEDNVYCFHRTLFIFVCRNASCCKPNESGNFKIWRNQLKKENNFYSSEPPVEDQENDFDIDQHVQLCTVCGCLASKHCSKCKITSYCSREHQISDWKAGHKSSCGTGNVQMNNTVLFDEWELVIDEEAHDVKRESEEEAEKRRLEEFTEMEKEGKVGTLADLSEEELQNHADVDEDKTFLQFRKRIGKNPDQILRYNRGGSPLWISDHPKPLQIPQCEYCGSERQFEFQILPQLLFTLHENSLDWGTLIIYSCKNSCSEGAGYKREYIFKQDIAS